MNWITFLFLAFGLSIFPSSSTILDSKVADKTQLASDDIESGSITGVIKYAKGKVRKELSVIKDEKTCGTKPLIDESLLTSDNGGLQWTVISIEGDVVDGKEFAKVQNKELIQKGCTFQPHVMVIEKGCEMTIKNEDPTLHNVRTVSFMNDAINKLQMYIPGQPAASDIVSFEEPEVVTIVCDVHGWMKSFVHVVDTPYHEVSDENGAFTMDNVPPGKYKLKVWHEKLGELSKTVEVTAGKASTVEFMYK